MRKYLLVDDDGRSRRGGVIEAEAANASLQYRRQIISQNIWECAETPLLAVLINPLHAESVVPRLFELRGNMDDDKFVLHRVREIVAPSVSPEQKLIFAMLCVRALTPDQLFSAWVDRWLSSTDRSVASVKRLRRQLEASAKKGDESLVALTEFGTRADEINRLYEKEFEFLRRACDVVDAATALLTMPSQWRVTLSERVATATNNVLSDKKVIEFSKRAIKTILTASNNRQMSEPRRVMRRRDDKHPRNPNVQAYAVYHRGELRIKGRNRTKPKD